jgi:Lrp/AsnC family transcriptional regulator
MPQAAMTFITEICTVLYFYGMNFPIFREKRDVILQIDTIDKRLLTELQRDSSRSIETLADVVGLSRNTCWRRVARLEEDGVIARRVALVDPAKVNLGLPVFIVVKAGRHNADATEQLRKAVLEIPEIVGAYRTAGEIDYILQARVPDVAAYDRLYKKLIAKLDMSDVSASFVMEEIKAVTELPLDFA